MTAPGLPTDVLASALPAGIQYHLTGGAPWRTAEVAKFQAERLAESGYVLVHPEFVDEATWKRLAAAVDDQLNGDALADGGYAFPDYLGERVAGAVLAALAGTAAPHERDGEVRAHG